MNIKTNGKKREHFCFSFLSSTFNVFVQFGTIAVRGLNAEKEEINKLYFACWCCLLQALSTLVQDILFWLSIITRTSPILLSIGIYS